MFENGILVADQCVDQKPKCSCDQYHFTLAFTEPDGRLERPDPINRLVMPNPGIHMIIPILFFCGKQEPNPILSKKRTTI